MNACFLTLCGLRARSTVPGSLENRSWDPESWRQVHSASDINSRASRFAPGGEPWALSPPKPNPRRAKENTGELYYLLKDKLTYIPVCSLGNNNALLGLHEA